MRIFVPKETATGEKRASVVPETAKKLAALGAEIAVEAGIGASIHRSDAEYKGAGASVIDDRMAGLRDADIVLRLRKPPIEEVASLREGCIHISYLDPFNERDLIERLAGAKVSAISMEMIPRTTIAQKMDALSSQANLAGYLAVVLAAEELDRIFPMMMTPAGTIQPARVFVIGVGVAGLQAIATAKRLGAVVEAYDVRAAAGEQVRSLGANFLEVDLGGIATEDAGGYARELTPEALKRGRDLIVKQARSADVIITTAAVPGKRAPLMLDDEAVLAMKRGSVVVDLAAPTGGNVSLSRPDEAVVTSNGVTILAPLNLAATIPYHASQLFSRNMTSFLQLLNKDGQLNVDMSDDVVGPACVTHQGQVVNARVAALLGEPVTR
jgi:NAD(P) transhydrogenase subunit alpha